MTILTPTAGAARLAAAKAAIAGRTTISNVPAPAADLEPSFAEAFAAGEFEFDDCVALEGAAIEAAPAAADDLLLAAPATAEPINDDPASAANVRGYTKGWQAAPKTKAASDKAAPTGSKGTPASGAAKKPSGGYIALGYEGVYNVIWSNTRNCVVRLKATEINLPVMETWAGLDWVMSSYMDQGTDEKKAAKLNIGRMRSDLIASCQAAGPFDDASVFGAGIWEVRQGDERVVVCNSRGKVFTADGSSFARITEAGIFAECRSFGMSPDTRSATDDEVAKLAAAIDTWRWRNTADSMLLLGWLAASPLCGVLDRRPAFYLTGARGCGKSTLLDLVARVLGDSAIKADGNDSSAAGIRQFMRGDARPLILDEFGDNESDSAAAATKVKAVISAIRTAYGDNNGEGILKGTADAKGASYSTQYMALLASIIPAPMKPADRSRMAVCSLAPLQTGVQLPPLVADTDAQEAIGNRLRMRMFRLWKEAKISIRYVRAAVLARGHEPRFADTFGTLLACWYVATTGRAIDQTAASLLVANTDLSSHAEALVGASDERECADWMLGYTERETGRSVGELIRLQMDGKAEYARVLEGLGLKIAGDMLQVCGSKEVQGIREVFAGSKFASGGWKIVLDRITEARPATPRFAGKATRSTAIPLAWLLEEPTQAELEV